MGMYTELIFGARLKPATPPEVINALQHLVKGELLANPPDHEFFGKDRAACVLVGSSYYFSGGMPPVLEYDEIAEGWRLLARADLKNYDGEIEAFLGWIHPFIESGSGEREFYAIVCYEDSLPEIWYLEDK